MAKQFDNFPYCNSMFCAMLSCYALAYFGPQLVWKWLCFNSVSMFVAFEIYHSWIAAGSHVDAGRGLIPMAMLFWSMAEVGDVVLFYKRFCIVQVGEIPSWLRNWFRGWIACAIVTRTIDIVMGSLNGLHAESNPNLRYIEPTYFVCLWMVEVVLQYNYFTALLKMKGVTRTVFLAKLLRSAGTRFLLITIPMFARATAEFSGSVNTDPSVTIAVSFSTAVNLFTLIDLLLTKYEMETVKSTDPMNLMTSPPRKETKQGLSSSSGRIVTSSREIVEGV
eukprot:TRINITY_DN70723_c0_g1_i1.p1 TRINITY_DN70723_c0_g1~~TRINITY_DN70723_c0_g1_i1.p1  ORF type:complete len:293 (-),score=62.37 TRINITY_DN70723_c0_g1_i1:26-859(-)